MSSAAEWVFVPICLWPLVLAALVFGLRGRKLDDHPFCRKCGFDLFGRAARDRAARDAARRAGVEPAAACPGCAADLSRRRAVGVGRRQRRVGLALAALPPLLVCTAWMACAGWYAAETCEWQAYKPDWWLAAEADSPEAGRRDAAWSELTNRMARGRLAPARVDELTGRALAGQGDAGRPWLAAWGEWVERARGAGLLSDEQWSRYAGQAVRFRLRVRPKVRRGDPFVLRLSVAPARVAAGRRFGLAASFAGDVRLDGQAVRAGRDVPRIAAAGGVCAEPGGGEALSRTVAYDLTPAVLGRLPDGPRTCRVSFDALVGERPDSADPALAEAHVLMEAPWELLPEGTPSVRLVSGTVDAPLERPAVSAGCRWADADRRRIVAHLVCQDRPVAVACDVFVRAAGREWPAGQVAWEKGTAGTSADVSTDDLPAEAAGAEKVDVVLRPGAAVAARTIGITEIWGEPVVVSDVEVVGGAGPAARR